MRGVRPHRLQMGAPPHLSELRPDVLLRFLTEQTREQARAVEHPPRGRVGRARRALALLLPRRGVHRVLTASSVDTFTRCKNAILLLAPPAPQHPLRSRRLFHRTS